VRNVLHLGAPGWRTTALTSLECGDFFGAHARALSDFGLLYLLMSIATFAYVVANCGHARPSSSRDRGIPDRVGELLGQCACRSCGDAC